jgi:hypothetical protein
MSAGWSITSPIALLDEWQGPAARDELQDLVLLGFTVNLPFLEKVAIRTARDLGAQVTVIGDAAHGVHDPVDVRLRSYFTAWAACQKAFHPKLALLIGKQETVAAIGSGNPTMAGWGHNDELWTVLRSGPDGSANGLRQLGDWLTDLPRVVAMPTYAADLLRDVAGSLTALPGDIGEAQVLHNLHQGLLSQLPGGPVDELCLYAPFVDQTGRALSEIFGHLDPGRVIIGLQDHWTSYDGDAILRAAGNRQVELRLLPERYPRHGKLLEWQANGSRRALTGSANLTQSALVRATADGANCELAVLAPVETTLMPKGTCITTTHLQGRCTAAEITPAPAVLLLGALLTRDGLVVTLARCYDMAVTIENSPDGSPGSWIEIGIVPAGRSEAVFPLSGWAGAAVRAVATMAGAIRAESPAVFTVEPSRCARRRSDDQRPRLQHSYTEEEIFTDAELARRFQNDLLRLIELNVSQRTGHTAKTGTPRRPVSPAVEDRWAAYLEDCEHAIGRSLTATLFGSLFRLMPRLSPGSGWGIDNDGPVDDPSDEPGDEPPNDAPVLIMRIMPSERGRWRRWIERLVLAATPGKPLCETQPDDDQAGHDQQVPLVLRCLIMRIMVQLLAHGIWDLDDDSWRDTLARLTAHLVSEDNEDVPSQARQQAAALAAVGMGLLRGGASLAGGKPADLIARRTWECVRSFVAEADPAPADDLLISPVHARAVVLNSSELEDTILLAMDDDPSSVVAAEFAGRGWKVELDGLVYRVSGAFTNPVSAAAQVATYLGQHHDDPVLVLARAADRWAFFAWRRPDLVLAHVPGNTWRHYRIDGSFTPASRFAGVEGLPAIGQVGRAVRLGQSPPAAVQDILAAAGTDHVSLLRIFTKTPAESDW